MDAGTVATGAFVLGVGGLLLMCTLVRRLGGDGGEGAVNALLRTQLHFGLAGLVIGLTLLPALQACFAELVDLGLVFFAGWFGLVAGCGFDLRIRRQILESLLPEALQAGLSVALIALVAYAAAHLTPLAHCRLSEVYLLLVASAVCTVGGGVCARGTGGQKAAWKQRVRRSSMGTAIGIFFAQLGASQAGRTSWQVGASFLAAGAGIAVESPGSRLFWSVLLGAATGLLCDLLTRNDFALATLLYLMLAALLLSGGVAVVLGFEPAWVGLVGGVWLINATLRRLDLLEVMERYHGFARQGLLLTAGWLLGQGLRHAAIDIEVFAWLVLFAVGLRPVARVGGVELSRYLLKFRKFGKRRIDVEEVFLLDDLALVIAAGAARILSLPVGTAVLAAVLAAQLLLFPMTIWLERLEWVRARGEDLALRSEASSSPRARL